MLTQVAALALLAFSLWSSSDPAASAQDAEPPPDTVIQAALEAASSYLQVAPDSLVVVAGEPHDWGDTSLGCPEPGRAYAQVITAGYLVTIDTDDGASQVLVHTDSTGQRTAIC
jgi:hypothetical protein